MLAKFLSMPHKQKARQLDSEGKCIVCEVQTSERTRGLCVTDYNRYLSALRQIPAERRESFELKLIERGKVLPSKQGQRLGIEDNVFAIELAEFLQRQPLTESEVQDAVDEADQLSKEHAENVPTEIPPKPKPKPKPKRKPGKKRKPRR